MPEKNAAASTPAPAQEQRPDSLLDAIIKEGRFAQDKDRARERGKDLMKEFLDEVVAKMEKEVAAAAQPSKLPKDAEAAITARIAEIDKIISAQLDEILHHEKFQKLEASWRGLRYLLDQSETNDQLKIKIFNVNKTELLRDLELAAEFDQSVLFKRVYEDEFGIFGGHPFGALIGDYEFGNDFEDIELLERLAQVAAAAHAPFVAAASPALLNLESYTEISHIRDISKTFDTTAYAKWKSFRQSDDSRYVGLVLPHILMRMPYGKRGRTVEAFDYQEKVGPDNSVDGANGKAGEPDPRKFLWGNAAYALASRLTDAFAKYGWCAAIRGPEGGGRVQGLNVYTFETDEGEVAMRCPTEVGITDRREAEFATQGLIPLVHRKNEDYAAFFSVQSCNKPRSYNTEEANASARLSVQLPYILAMCRFAHFLKVMMRDKIGSFTSRKDCQFFLNNWIGQYVTADDTAPQSVKAEHPLREAHIEVEDVPGKPGVYRATAFLKPHFQLDKLDIALRLVAELPASVRK